MQRDLIRAPVAPQSLSVKISSFCFWSRDLIHLFSFASGAVALVFEVLWMRRFAVLFGSTAPAAAATLSAFFLGMAAGSAVLGKRAARWRRPLRVFGILQAAIAGGALLVEPILRLYDGLYPSIYPSLSGSPGCFFGIKILLATIAIFIPTFLMGGALPILGEALLADSTRLGARSAGIYAVNTLGAAAGALAVPFVLLPWLGADGGFLAAGTICFAQGALSWLRDAGPSARAGATHDAPPRAEPRDGAKLAWWVAALAFVSGLLQLALEVLWIRMFALVHENSVYSFSAVLAVFLLGLAGGAALAKVLLRRGVAPKFGLAIAWSASGLWALLTPRLFLFLTSGMDYLVSGGGAAGGLRLLVYSALILLPATLLSGAALPFILEMAGGSTKSSPGPAIGRILAANTAGSILGPLLAGFLTGSGLGLWWSIALAGTAMIVAGAAAFGGLSLHPKVVVRRVAILALAAAAVWLVDPGGLPRARIDTGKGESIVCLREGSYGTVAIVEEGAIVESGAVVGRGHLRVLLNNHYLLGGTASAGDERQQGHLPLLLHPAPKRVAFLGLGTGITAGAALLHPVESVVAVEIVPEIIHAAQDHFAEANLKLLQDPRVQVVAEDARNYLKGSGSKFDVIVGDLFVPWRPGESALYSEEHFRTVREALLPGGLFCQWLPLFQLSEEGFHITAATFLDVFPKSTLWRGDFLADQPAVALIGRKDGEPLDAASIDRRARDLADRIDRVNPYLADAAGIWLFLMGPLDPMDPRYAGARRNRDGRPWIEILTPGLQAGAAASGTPVPHARFLARLFEEMRKKPLGATALEGLGAGPIGWRDAGAELWNASILAAEGKPQEAQAKAIETFRTLPAKLQLSVLGRELSHEGR